MKGDEEVLEMLGDVLSAELTGINQYFIHSMMQANWRYKRLADRSRKESIEEMRHAEEIMQRMIYLDGAPNVQRYMRIDVGQTVPDQHQYDLNLEKDAVARMNRGIELCRAKGDNGSRVLLEKLLHDEEEHVDWLESQLQQIQEMGLPNYLALQVGAE
jgi:bacterioferritin